MDCINRVSKSDRTVLETLATTKFLEESTNPEPKNIPWIWLTQNSLSLSTLPQGSRWVLWQDVSFLKEQVVINKEYPGIILHQEKTLQLQLQQSLHSL